MTDNYDNEGLTFEDILEILEDELLTLGTERNENPYRPLNFHDSDEGFEE